MLHATNKPSYTQQTGLASVPVTTQTNSSFIQQPISSGISQQGSLPLYSQSSLGNGLSQQSALGQQAGGSNIVYDSGLVHVGTNYLGQSSLQPGQIPSQGLQSGFAGQQQGFIGQPGLQSGLAGQQQFLGQQQGLQPGFAGQGLQAGAPLAGQQQIGQLPNPDLELKKRMLDKHRDLKMKEAEMETNKEKKLEEKADKQRYIPELFLVSLF